MLEELHPLEKTELRAAFPWLGAVTCYKGPEGADASVADEEAQLIDNKQKKVEIGGKSIAKKAPKKKKNNVGDAAVREDPLAKLGFGIVAYIDMLWTLIWTFTLYSIMLIPTFMYFAEGGAYSHVPEAVKGTYLDTYLGSMGYASVQCTQIPVSINKISLGCPYGVIGEFLDYGVNPIIGDSKVCMSGDKNSKCRPNNSALLSELDAAIGKD